MKQNSSTEKSKNRGFTLVELIVVIAILAILSAVGAVAYTGYIEYTKKGLDKKTVGEIMNALQLADYANPGLIKGRIQIFFTKDDGIVIPTDVSGKVTDALEDTFGEGALPNTKPSYDKWGSVKSPNLNLSEFIENVLNDDANLDELIQNYASAVSGGGAASFAGDIDTLWDTVGNLVELSKNAATGGFGAFFKPDDVGHLFEKAIENSTQEDTAKTILEKWTATDTQSGIFEMNGNEAAALVARNYAFASYAMKHPAATKEMKDVLNAYTNTDSLGNNIATQYLTDTANFSGEAWNRIKSDYITTGQARIDAEAFLGIMKVAGSTTVTPNIGESNDDAYLRVFSDHTNELSALLSDPSLLSTLQEPAGGGIKNVNSENGISFAAQKINGVLVFSDFSNPDADPTGGSVGKNTVVDEEDCTEAHNTALTIDFNNKNPVLKDATEINLCSKNSKFKSCTLTIMRDGSVMTSKNINVEVTGAARLAENKITSNGTFTIEATSAGEATLTVTWGTTCTFTCQIKIH